ncbi:MAG: nitrous oxide reductase family maturation protein NosD [Rhodocyclaceae bacterium]|nr:nitrous oxide reductase family maturation protein NosD [Rhodocyclaceae bacterium]
MITTFPFRPGRWLALAGCLLPWLAQAGLPIPLQPLLDNPPPSGVVRLAPGVYAGPATLRMPLVVDGGGVAELLGDRNGTVLRVEARGATVRGLRIRGSGDSHDRIDAGIAVEGDGNVIEGNDLDDVLFGIVLHNGQHNVLRDNTVRSRGVDTADRGDGIRLWNAAHNLIEGNDIAHVRDLTISNSPYNRFVRNRIRDSRRAMNFLFSHRSRVEENTFEGNDAGIVVINSSGFLIRRNQVMHSMSSAGACIALKETTAALVEENEIVHCATGIMADSPSNPVSQIFIHRNRVAHNIVGVHFYGERGGRIVMNNRFEHNLWQVTTTAGGNPELESWHGNLWDDYQGFDLDQDGVGDRPYELLAYADRIWMQAPETRFFRNSPFMELVDFLERLAPFAYPALVLRDEAPRMSVAAPRR